MPRALFQCVGPMFVLKLFYGRHMFITVLRFEFWKNFSSYKKCTNRTVQMHCNALQDISQTL